MFFHFLNDFFGRDDFQSVSEGAAPAEENRAELNGGSELNTVGAAVDNDGFLSELIIDDIQPGRDLPRSAPERSCRRTWKKPVCDARKHPTISGAHSC